MNREQIACMSLDGCCLSLNRRRVVPLYRRRRPIRFTESRGRLIIVSASVSTLSTLYLKLHDRTVYKPQILHMGPKPLWAITSSSYSTGLMIIQLCKCNPDLPCRFIPASNIPDIRPQIDLNLFMLVFEVLYEFPFRNFFAS